MQKMNPPHCMKKQEIYEEFSTGEKGLSNKAAEQKLIEHGKNENKSRQKRIKAQARKRKKEAVCISF